MFNDNKRQKLNQSESLTNCGTFSGSTALEFLIFCESWKAYMRSAGVEDMIVHGMDCGKPIQELLFETPDRFQIICEIQNEQIEDKKKSYYENYLQLINESPWLAYWWMKRDVPTSRQCSPDPITKARRNYKIPSDAEFRTVLDLLPLGFEGILGPDKTSQVEEFYPGVLDTPPDEDADPHAVILSVTVFNDFATDLSTLQTRIQSWDYEEQRKRIENEEVTEEDFVPFLSNKNQNRIKTLFVSRVKTHKEQSESLKLKYKACTTVFNKIGTSNLKSVQRELDDFDFHAAYKKLVTIYVSKGIANTEDFEIRAKKIFLQPGQSINDHWNCLCEAIKRWATVLAYLQDLKNHFEVRGEPTYVPVCDREEAEANSGELRDQQIIDLGFTVHISESVRYRILNNSLSKYTDRFSSVMDIMSGLPLKKRFIKNYLERLRIREDDQAGQNDIANELNQISKDESSSKKAMSAMKTSKSPAKKFPVGSCKNHPMSTSHDTNSCTGGKSNSVSKAKRDFKPCDFCKVNNPSLANSHPNERCFSDKKSPMYKGEKSANIAEDDDDEEDIVEKSKSKKSPKKRKSQGQLTRKDFKSKSAYSKFTRNQDQMSDFLKYVKIDKDADDSSEDK
jgi:hypothetical protein